MAAIVLLLAALPMVGVAGGFTAPGVPTRVDIVRSEGFMVFGSFGNAAGCTVGNQVFVRSEHPQYKAMFAMVVTAYVAKQKVSFYSGDCEAVTWYTTPAVTYNTVTGNESMTLSD
ncbi:MAG: hypothetical protein JNM97_23375 [Rhodoferax sp.]|nr:hypothetical protein [Rhodoferax sp.]